MNYGIRNYGSSYTLGVNNNSPRNYYAGSMNHTNGSSQHSSSTGTSPDLHRNIRTPEDLVHDVLNSALDCPVDIGSDSSLSPPTIGFGENNILSYLNSFNECESEMNEITNHNFNNNFMGVCQIQKQNNDRKVPSMFTQNDQSPPQSNGQWSYDSPPRLSSPDDILMLDQIWNSSKLVEPIGNSNQMNNQVLSCQLNELLQMTLPRCDKHCMDHSYFCQTCNKTICNQCIFESHSPHEVTHLMSSIETNSAKSREIINTCKNTKKFIMERDNSLQESIRALDAKQHEAVSAVKNWFAWYMSVIQTREQELLSKIENAYRLKNQALRSHSRTLKNYATRLQVASSDLLTAINTATITTNPVSLIKKKDTALAQLYQVRQSFLGHPENEEGWIVFNPPDDNQIYRQISNLGAVITISPGIVGDRRSKTSASMLSQIDHAAPFEPKAVGKAVPGFPRPVMMSTPQEQTDPILEIGNRGSENEQLCRPWGVACDAEGRIVVADRSNNRIMIFGMNGKLIRQFGSLGSAAGQFDRPAGIAVDSLRRIVVADKDNHRVQVMTMEGKHLFMFGQKGNLCGQFNYPWDVAVNTECDILVSDTRNHRVQHFSPSGHFLRKFGFEALPHMLKSFDSPRGVVFDPSGNVVLTDFNTHRVVIIDSEFSSFTFLGDNDNCREKPQFSRPQGVIMDDAGNYIVADSKNCQIQIFNRDGIFLRTLGSTGSQAGKMDRPSGMAMTPDGRIAIVDFGNNRVVIF